MLIFLVVTVLIVFLIYLFTPSNKVREKDTHHQNVIDHKTMEQEDIKQEREVSFQHAVEEESKRNADDPVAPFCLDHEFCGKYEFIHEVRIVGVTFKNERRSRQTIFRQIYWRDPLIQ